MKPILVLQNDSVEGAGRLSTQMIERDFKQHTLLGWEAQYDCLSNDDFSALVVLGGPQSAYQTEEYPYLRDEIALCRNFLNAGKPILGLCLGAQLLACAAGGEVEPGERKEVGWYDLRLCKAAIEDPLLHGHPETLVSCHFHGDRIRDVPGGIKLASSALTPIQLFRLGDNAYGFQYHAEVDETLLELMCRNNADYLVAGGVNIETVIEDGRTFLPDFERHCRTVLDRWLDLAAAPA
jgi:GMP synthase (glutamine-hydrolysing)